MVDIYQDIMYKMYFLMLNSVTKQTKVSVHNYVKS